jgi:hypothetical protein
LQNGLYGFEHGSLPRTDREHSSWYVPKSSMGSGSGAIVAKSHD